MANTFYLGYRVDPESGTVYGWRGKPIRKIDGAGYVQASRRNTFAMQAHRLVWQSVHGAIPEGLQINHINGVKSDNRIANLELVTGSENCKHAYRIGLSDAKGVNNGRYKHGRYVGAK